MNINSDINILGSMADWNLIRVFMMDKVLYETDENIHEFTHIKTQGSVRRFVRAINRTFLHFKNQDVEHLYLSLIEAEQLSGDALLFLFWNASANNDLVRYLTEKVYFPAFYGGRITIRKEKVEACILELKSTEIELQDWTLETIKTTARKYISLLGKFGLMEGAKSKEIRHPHLSDKMFILYAYWLTAINETSNLINSPWLSFNFMEKQVFIERLLQKRFSKYINVIYTGDRLTIEPVLPYTEIYHHANKS